MTLWTLCLGLFGLLQRPWSHYGKFFFQVHLENSYKTHVLSEIITFLTDFVYIFFNQNYYQNDVLLHNCWDSVGLDALCIYSCITKWHFPCSKNRNWSVQHCSNCNEKFLGTNERENLLSPHFQGFLFTKYTLIFLEFNTDTQYNSHHLRHWIQKKVIDCWLLVAVTWILIRKIT